jgi:hypothetical protein
MKVETGQIEVSSHETRYLAPHKKPDIAAHQQQSVHCQQRIGSVCGLGGKTNVWCIFVLEGSNSLSQHVCLLPTEQGTIGGSRISERCALDTNGAIRGDQVASAHHFIGD